MTAAVHHLDMDDRGADEQRLYAWVRVFGAIMFTVTIVLTVLAILILPVIVPGYDISEGTVVVILASLSTSALALVNVQVVLRRNGK